MTNTRLTAFLFALVNHFMITCICSYSASQLTAENWNEMTHRKTVFVNFRTEHCAHCRELGPVWEKLALSFDDSDHGLVAEVNCDKEVTLCKELNVIGTPTLYYGDPSVGGIFLEEFGGDRDLENLSDFAAEVLVPMCTIHNIFPCSREIARNIRDWTHMSFEKITELVTEKEDEIKSAETLFVNENKKLQAVHDKLNNAHELEKARMQTHIRSLKDLLTSKKQTC
mmetsp:Transcript_9789/g.9449  ORF Transcript_9789/g.9449 Transcript_9789/m.9449 type:complete len:226 (-) Transcript_9789:119-796(-)|eukprot:CAMPEP_0197835828 /NCGR_PEP_ID=MMETSP1437-20131217/27078_1 /TAXON_ID=49252 ORGANISM="Eucampia antarctica, Strain CCMP1452" /NCGR_SAMPLE_ID=MMETSP1437 /ASSEMBLY_ACC=CAM_ASM_001096 /LENGTH=225 /DNA_ID=CAMNT_0043441537 /DNA_START=65 /DNA_END=742 /DNA_ORIENTATION=+